MATQTETDLLLSAQDHFTITHQMWALHTLYMNTVQMEIFTKRKISPPVLIGENFSWAWQIFLSSKNFSAIQYNENCLFHNTAIVFLSTCSCKCAWGVLQSFCFHSDLPSPSKVCPCLIWSGRYGYLHYERVHCCCRAHRGQGSNISYDKTGNWTNNQVYVVFALLVYFILHSPMSHSRYGEYLGVLDVSPPSLPHSARLEKVLARTSIFLQCQQHARKKTRLSKCMAVMMYSGTS